MKVKTFIAIGLALVLMAGCAPRAKQQAATPTCPPRPQRQTASSIIQDYWEPTGRITFYADAIESYAEDFFSEFGGFYPDSGNSYTLWVDARYDFNEVLEYLQRSECHLELGEVYWGDEAYRKITPTPTLEPGEMRITDGPALYGAIDGDRCWVDIPLCGDRVCPVEWGQEVSCDDMETPVQAEVPPTPTPTPTLTPDWGLDSTADLQFLLDSDVDTTRWLGWTQEWRFTPENDEETLEIDWVGSIFITNAFSITLTITGPITLRFTTEQEEHE